MPQFRLVFRDTNGDRKELRDTTDGEPHINGALVADGAIIAVRGERWLATREDLEDELIRFVCTPVGES